MIRATTLMNEQGDTTITWDEDQDDFFEKAIQAKMDQGIIFFIIEPRPGLPAARTKVTGENITKIHEQRALLVKDEHFSSLIAWGKGDVVKTPAAPVKSIRKARTAKEAASAQTVGVTPLRGG